MKKIMNKKQRPKLNLERFKKRNRITNEIEVEVNNQHGFILKKRANDNYFVVEQLLAESGGFISQVYFKTYKEAKNIY